MNKDTLTYKILEYMHPHYMVGAADLMPVLEKEYGVELPIKWRMIQQTVAQMDKKYLDVPFNSQIFMSDRISNYKRDQHDPMYSAKLLVKITEGGYDLFNKLNPPAPIAPKTINVIGDVIGSHIGDSTGDNTFTATTHKTLETDTKKKSYRNTLIAIFIGTITVVIGTYICHLFGWL